MFYVLGMFAVQFIEEASFAWIGPKVVRPATPKRKERNWWWVKPLLLIALGQGWVALISPYHWWYGFAVSGGAVILERLSDLLIATTFRKGR